MNREAHLEVLRQGTFDILVIGGGATGSGIALDAASRGHKVALVEKDDFSSGTSSRSTKLIHGGVRYLEQAVKHFDRTQFNLVRDALKERAILLNIAPHLAKPLPLVTPLYNWLEVPYYLTGLKLYDWLAGKANLHPSRFVDSREALDRFPMLKPEGLRGGVIYYDGQFDDARMNVSLALTAASQGAIIANHVGVIDLIKSQGHIAGAALKDELTGDEWEVSAKVVINATGPFVDHIRKMDDPDCPNMLLASSGAHLVLDKRFSPPDTGLLIPETEDGRVLFLLPWLGHTLVGTTDNPAELHTHPKASEDDISYILHHIQKYFNTPIDRSDVKASFSGLRPLVSDPNAVDTAQLSRDHIINRSDSGLLSIAGGKWTTYRKMALDAVDEAERQGLEKRECVTSTLKLIGAAHYSASGAGQLQELFCLPADIASYLNRSYGDRAEQVASLAGEGYGNRLSKNHSYLEAEIIYAARHEAARTIVDILARRTRLGFLDKAATLQAIPKVADILSTELSWNDQAKRKNIESAETYFS